MALDDENPITPGSDAPERGDAPGQTDGLEQAGGLEQADGPERRGAAGRADVLRERGLRTITDARTMRALSHPVRIAVMEALTLGGPMTATEVGEQIDESPTTCSFHLRQLAKYGFVEEAGGGKGRARPWRIAALGFSIPSTHDDPEADIAATTLGSVFRERQLRRYETWKETRSTYPAQWREAATDSEYIMYLTVDELEEVTRQLHEVLMPRWRDGRLTDPSLRPPGSVPVELLMFAYPMELPKAGGGGKPSPDGDDEPGPDGGAR